MKKYLFSSMLLGGLMMASCSENVLETPQVEETQKTYAQKFQEMLGGPVSRTQDFNTLQNFKLNVTLAEAGDIKVYARVNSEVVYQLVGNFENMAAGTHELVVDGPENWNDFAVEVGNEVKCTKGEALTFSRVLSRNYRDENAAFSLSGTVIENGEIKKDENGNPVKENVEKTFTIDEVSAFLTKVPAGINNYGRTDIAMNFKVMNEVNRKIRIYPVYWVASYRHIFGIYTYNDNGTIGTHYDIYDSRMVSPSGKPEDLQISKDGGINWTSADNNNTITAYPLEGSGAPTHVKSQGFEVTLPDDGKTYGFYIKVYENGIIQADGERYNRIWYSDVDLNADKLPHAAYFQANVARANTEETMTRTFLGFEDIGHGGGDKDLNDFVFIVEPEPIIIDKTPISWTLAAEDLGNIDDFDFNDVVVSLQKVAGQKELNITALAAGGTLPVKLQYNGQDIQPAGAASAEFHSWFGVNGPGADGNYEMINTKSITREGMTATLTLDKDFTLTKFMDAENNSMGGFKIVVDRERNDNWTTKLTSPQNGTAPQMMCLPIGWAWPTERTRMVDAYQGFQDWGQGYLNDKTNAWAYQYNEGKVVQ